jgi:O-antigen biosynthesis protein
VSKTKQESTAILVLGMHRSGTSALTRMLNLLGVGLGKELMAPKDDNNRLGFWEDQKVVDIHDALLKKLDRSWDDLRELPDGWLDTDAAADACSALIDHLKSEFDGMHLWVVKDPRMCRLVPLWQQVLKRLNVRVCALLTVRHPWEVAASLMTRDGMGEAKARLLWLEHMVDAERSTRHLPRLTITYDQLLADWQACADRITRALGISWPVPVDQCRSEIDAFLTNNERHHRASQHRSTSDTFEDASDRLYHAFDLVAQGSAWSVAEAISDECSAIDPAFVNALAESQCELSHLQEMGAEAESTVHGAVTVYFSGDSGLFSEDNAVTAEISAERATYLLKLPQRTQYGARLRVDPTNKPGWFLVHALTLRDANSDVLWHWTPGMDGIAFGGVSAWIDANHPQGEYNFAWDDDPQMVLELPEAVASKIGPGCEVAIDLDFVAPPKYIANFRHVSFVDSDLARQQEQAISQREANVGVAETSLANRMAMQAEFESLLLAKSNALDARETGVGVRETAVAIRENSLSDHEESLGLLEASMSAREIELQKLSLQWDGDRAQLEDERAQLEYEIVQNRQELMRIKSSAAWRFASRLSSVSDRLPPSVRHRGGQIAKAAWWVVTPWRLPARVRFLYRRRHIGGVVARNDLERIGTAGSNGAGRWHAVGSDPSFTFVNLHGTPLAVRSGWHLLDIKMAAESGQLRSPCLYLDYGNGYTERSMVDLSPFVYAKGVRGLICVHQRALSVRFDPSVAQCEFTLRNVSLSRIPTSVAIPAMFRALIRRGVRLGTLVRQYRSRRESSLVEWLYGQYLPRVGRDRVSYNEWIKRYGTVGELDVLKMRKTSRRLAVRPTISILLPVCDAQESSLRRCIESVMQQAYPYWELCAAGDASSAPHVEEVLREYAAKDSRIKVTFGAFGGYFSSASNAALSMAIGEWLVVLGQGDELPQYALYMLARAVNERRGAKLFYGDEDRIDGHGNRSDPYFKPDWNHDLFLSQNLIGFTGGYRLDAVRDVGGFRKQYEGAHGYDLALRLVETLTPSQIVHIPYVLYHVRTPDDAPQSERNAGGSKDTVGEKALRNHLARVQEDADVDSLPCGGYRVRRHHRMARFPKVSLIIPTRDRVELVRMSVGSIIEKTDYPNYEIIVVDNQSVEKETLEYFKEIQEKDSRVKVMPYDAPFNYSAINNAAVRASDGEIVGLINNDIEVIHADWLREMVSHAMRPEIGAVGAMLYYPDDTIQHAGVILGMEGLASHIYTGERRGYPGNRSRAMLLQNLSAVTAACLLIRREIFDEVDGLDTQLQVAFNDVDFCLRVREKGYRNLWTPYAELYHHESASRGQDDTPVKAARGKQEIDFMLNRWGASLFSDPAYNPNLTLWAPDSSIAETPRVASLTEVIRGGIFVAQDGGSSSARAS